MTGPMEAMVPTETMEITETTEMTGQMEAMVPTETMGMTGQMEIMETTGMTDGHQLTLYKVTEIVEFCKLPTGLGAKGLSQLPVNM